MSDIRAVIGQPLYLAMLFWPLLALALKPHLWQKSGWREGIIAYSVCFAVAMAAAVTFSFIALSLGQS